jgi:general secretion pathway protein A
MYNDYFGFKETPFSIAPDPRYLFMTAQHREALAHLVYGLNSEGGCILLTGEVGTGKTTVCRCLLNQIPDKANIALVLNPKVSARELLGTICDELNISTPADASIKTFIDSINRFLIDSHARGEKTVLIIDEAQNLDKTVLEQLRLLTNLETDRRKLLQIIILGQPELIDILSSDEMRQLAQRITARFHLKPLTREDIKAYINHRLAVAGQNVQLFPDNTIKKLYSLSKGIPRLINILCDRALLGAYVQNKYSVDNATLEQAAKEVFGEIKNVTHKKDSSTAPTLAAIAAGILLAGIAGLLYYNGFQSGETAVVAEQIDEAVQVASQTDIQPRTVVEAATGKTAEPVATTTVAESIEREVTPAIDMIAGFINSVATDNSDNKAAAYSALFTLWGQEYDEARHRKACTRATEVGLSCLHKQGNLTSVRKINRPVVVKLYDADGNHAFAIVTRLKDKTATLNTGAGSFDVSAEQLDRYWLGEYTLLWQKPPYYENALTPGNNGPTVQWLDQQMVRLYGNNAAPTISDTYTGDLITQVKKFQLSKGLVPDGVAGPLTFILLNTELGAAAPLLDRLQES